MTHRARPARTAGPLPFLRERSARAAERDLNASNAAPARTALGNTPTEPIEGATRT